MLRIAALDHLVLTVADIGVTAAFYRQVLGMKVVRFENDRVALKFGNQKINLHEVDHEIKPHARQPTPGSADLCFLTDDSLDGFIDELHDLGIEIELGPVRRSGAMGLLDSVYFRDPDGNLIEVSNTA
jgi:catechol 2,3-dioxygenase-like lactoylglutathione lyase family enzyme